MNGNKSSLLTTSNSYLKSTNNNLNVPVSGRNSTTTTTPINNLTYHRNDSNLFPVTKKVFDTTLVSSATTNTISNNKRATSPLYRLAVQTLKSRVVLRKEKEKDKDKITTGGSATAAAAAATTTNTTTQLTKLPLTTTHLNQTILNTTSNSLSNLISNSNGLHNVFMLGNDIRVGRKIGNGNFGEIRLGKNLNTGEDIAIKFEKSNGKATLLNNEFKLYKRLQPHEGIPNVYNYIENGSHNSLVMELLGPSLEELFNLCNRVFSLKTICMIAIQVLQRIEYVHSHNIVYRDIKPENFLIGRQSLKKDHIIHLIDYGLAKDFINSDTGKHIPYSDNKNLTGTARYMSINTHLGREQSRRDDLEAIAHMLLYFIRGSLPWQGLKVDNIKERYKRISEIKQTTKIDDLCKDLPQQFSHLLNYSRKLEFTEKPDYQSQIRGFQDLMKSKGWWPINWNKFDWSDHLTKLNNANNKNNISISNGNLKQINNITAFKTTTVVNANNPNNRITYSKLSTMNKNISNQRILSVSKLTNTNSQEAVTNASNNKSATATPAIAHVKNQYIQSRISHLTSHFASTS